MAEAESPNEYLEDKSRRRPQRLADADSSNEYSEDNPRRRPFHQNQNMRSHTGRGRGRGRTDLHVMKAMNIFGVRDLRELLDRRRQEEQLRDAPPADPSYNYFSDPEREDLHNQYKGWSAQAHQGGPASRRPRGRGNTRGREKVSFIQNPLNIKVQFSTSTGKRNYLVDEEDTLDDIKHVPDHMYSPQLFAEGFRGRGLNWRGRPRELRGRGSEERGRGVERKGRGRGRGPSTWSKAENFGDGTEIRAKSVERSGQLYENEVKEHKARGRGRYVRSRSVETRDRDEETNAEWEPRGRGGSARGRGQRRGRGKRQSNPPERKTHIADFASEQFNDADENLGELSKAVEGGIKDEAESLLQKERAETKEKLVITSSLEGPCEATDDAIGDQAGSLQQQKGKSEMKEKLVVTTSSRETRKRSVRFDLKDDDKEKSELESEKNVDNGNKCPGQGQSRIDYENSSVDADVTTKGKNCNKENEEEVVNEDSAS